MSTPRIDAAYNELIAKHGYTDAFDVLAVGRQLETELQAKDRTIERLREALEQVSYRPGGWKEIEHIEYCFFCSYSRDWIAKNGHGNTCPLHQEST